MSAASLDQLRAAHDALDLALDGCDPRAIESAADRYRAAIFDSRAVGVWRARPELARTAADLLGRVETAQQRVKALTRDSRERLAAIAAVRCGARYGRTGSTTA